MACFVGSLCSSDIGGSTKALDAAIEAAESHVHDLHSVVKLLLNRGFCYELSKKYLNALSDYDNVLRRDPENVQALSRKGFVLSALERNEEAKVLWQKALSVSTCATDAALLLNIKDALQNKKERLPVFKSSSLLLKGLWVFAFCLPLILGISLHAFAPIDVTEVISNLPVISVKVLPSDAALRVFEAPSLVLESRNDTKGDESAVTLLFEPVQPAEEIVTENPYLDPPAYETAEKPVTPKKGKAKDNASPKKASKKKESKTKAVKPKQSSAALDDIDVSSMDPNHATTQAVQLINTGLVLEAEALLEAILDYHPPSFGAYIARGTARALLRKLPEAVKDFTQAISMDPKYIDTYRRRAQAYNALWQLDEALEDLLTAERLSKSQREDPGKALVDIQVEMGVVYHKLKDYRMACDIFNEILKKEDSLALVWNYYGLCQCMQGHVKESLSAYEKSLKLNNKSRETWVNYGQVLKEAGDTEKCEGAYRTAFTLSTPDSTLIAGYKNLAAMKQQMGRHAEAVEILNEAMKYAADDQMVELLFVRGACYHAQGYVRDAVNSYEDAMTWQAGGMPNDETRSLQFVAFYQKELALYMASHLDQPVMNFSMDVDLLPLFKEHWCNKAPPSAELVKRYKVQKPLPYTPLPAPPLPDPQKLDPLLNAAEHLGGLLQNNHSGFLPHVRAQRGAGLAAIELGQVVEAAVAARRNGGYLYMEGNGSTISAHGVGLHRFGWRDAMDILIKWRQLSEPNDQVVWIDLMTRTGFEQGFGSHTPILQGQTKTIRYYGNFPRCLARYKTIVLEQGYVTGENEVRINISRNLEPTINAAKTAEEMYKIIKASNWVVMHIASTLLPDKPLEGTRFLLVKTHGQRNGYDFSIRTPVTPPRWERFDSELEAAWDAVIDALADEAEPAKLAPLIMTYAYYWYNFMPLARGTAAAGYTTMLSLFWVAGMPVTATIPYNFQVDWEAILALTPEDFMAALAPWFYPAAVKGEEASSQEADLPPLKSLPLVSEVIPTLRQRIEALNDRGAKRVLG